MVDDVDALRTAAEDGDPVAMWRYGSAVASSDRAEASMWLRRSAESGDRVGMRRYATFLAKAQPDESKEWYERASDAGDPAASCYLADLVAKDDPERARQLWERAAEGGIVAGLDRLGRWWASRDPVTAARWFRQAVDAGVPSAMVHLVLLLADRDPVEAEMWRTRIEAECDPQSVFALGRVLAAAGDTDRSIRVLELASALGVDDALARAGMVAYAAGRPRQGRQLLTQGAYRGSAFAMSLLIQRLGRSDRRAARAWAAKVEQADDSRAWTNLANALRFRHPVRSHRLLRRAADVGEPNARGVLAAKTSVLDAVDARFRSDGSVRQARRREWAAQGAAAGNRLGIVQHALNLYFAGEKDRAVEMLLGTDGVSEAFWVSLLYLFDHRPKAAAAQFARAAGRVRRGRRRR